MYYKILFYDGRGNRTAGVVVDTAKYPLGTSIEEYSRLLPYSEAMKMKRFYRSSLFQTFDEAFLSNVEAI